MVHHSLTSQHLKVKQWGFWCFRRQSRKFFSNFLYLSLFIIQTLCRAFGINTPLFYLAHQITADKLSDKVLMLQIYLGCAWIVGCSIFGLLVVKNSVECRIARQYLCQTAMLMCGLAMLALTTIDGNYQAYLLFVWIYGEMNNMFTLSDDWWVESLGIFVGGYHYSLKMFTFEKVRARNFARAWGFVQFSQVNWMIKFLYKPLHDIHVSQTGPSDCFWCSSCRLLEPEFNRTSRLLSLCCMLNHRQFDVILGWLAQEKCLKT